MTATPVDTRPMPVNERPQFVFSLLPKAFQKRPLLDFNVITEMTDEGRKVAPPSPENPVYYVEQPGKFLQIGSAPPANEHAPPLEVLEQAMQKALAAGGYLAKTPAGRQPALIVVFNYGSHSIDPPPTPEEFASDDPPPPAITAEELFHRVMADPGIAADLDERAGLIGGAAFAVELRKKLVEETENMVFNAQARGMTHLPVFPEFASPLSLYLQSAKNSELARELVEDAFHSCYFVVASAYDYAAMAHGQRRLLWRTKMTVDADGVNMKESLAPLIVSAGPYFGRDMKEVTVLSKRISREGTVTIGTPTVVEDNAPAPTATPAPANAGKK